MSESRFLHPYQRWMKRQVKGGNISEVDAIEVRVRGSKGDQGWKEAVLVRIKGDTDNRGEAVELLQELYEIQLSLMVYKSYGVWQVWTRVRWWYSEKGGGHPMCSWRAWRPTFRIHDRCKRYCRGITGARGSQDRELGGDRRMGSGRGHSLGSGCGRVTKKGSWSRVKQNREGAQHTIIANPSIIY